MIKEPKTTPGLEVATAIQGLRRREREAAGWKGTPENDTLVFTSSGLPDHCGNAMLRTQGGHGNTSLGNRVSNVEFTCSRCGSTLELRYVSTR